MFDISLYPLFFLAKSKPQKGRRPSPLHTPGLLGKTSALVLVWGSIFVAWYGAWISRGGNLPPKSTLTQGVPPNPQPIQTKISRPGPLGKFFTILDQKTKFPSNIQPRVCRGTGDVPLQFTLLPKSEKRARGIHSPGKKKFFTLAFSKKISRKLNFLQFFRRQFLRRTCHKLLKRLRRLRNRHIRTSTAHTSTRTSHTLDHTALKFPGFRQSQHLLTLRQALRMLNMHRNFWIIFIQTGLDRTCYTTCDRGLSE